MRACQRGQLRLVQRLLDAGAQLSAHRPWDEAPLRAAAEYGHADVVGLLLERGADVHADHDAAIVYAAMNGYLEVVRLLLDAGAHIHAPVVEGDNLVDEHTRSEHDALCWAAQKGHLEVVRFLLDRGANVHGPHAVPTVPRRGDYGVGHHSPLRLAAEYGHAEIVDLLLDRGADIHACDDQALRQAGSHDIFPFIASRADRLKVVRLLIRRGADVAKSHLSADMFLQAFPEVMPLVMR